jgi:hypothetical protein
MGQKTLRQFCSEEEIELSLVISRLNKEGYTVRKPMATREIVNSKSVYPREFRNTL